MALQSLIYRYTRGDAELTIRLGSGRNLRSCVAGDRCFLDALRLAAEEPVGQVRRHLGPTPVTLTWCERDASGPDTSGLTLVAAAAVGQPGDGALRTQFVVGMPPEGSDLPWQTPQLLAHWHTLLTGLATQPELRLGDAPLLDNAELALLRDVLSGAEIKAPAAGAERLVELFERQARRRPDQLAVICDGVELSYEELSHRANQLANHLRSRGIGRGTAVCLYVPRSADVFVGMLGILKAGAAYVPIDPDYPDERVAFIVRDSGEAGAPAPVVTVSQLGGKASLAGCPLVRLDADWPAIAREAVTPAVSEAAGPEDLAYVIYTSGSTGKPKGVMIENRHALAFLKADAAYYGVRADDRVYQGFSVAFDASVEEIWLAFQAGATLVAATSAVARSGPELATFLNEQRISVYSTVPTALMMLDDPLPTVRILILGGEECSAELVRRFSHPARRLVNSYGPTEATVVVTATDTQPGRKVTIGRPLAGVRVYVLDQWLKPLPLGMPGELCLAGPTIARGYVGRPDLTAEKFVPVPEELGGQPGERLYRTGDLVRFATDGELEFLGRIDSQVKLRGFRIELGEIEARLAAEPGIRNAAVMLREDEPGLKELVAYVVPHQGTALATSSLRGSLREKLPSYMVPAHVEVLRELPALPSGKVDKKRLPRPSRQIRDEAAAFRGRPPATPTEVEVLALWQRLFHPEPVGMSDDFFVLGGHSLLATRMISELRKNPSHATASVLSLYQHPTLEAFAETLAPTGSVPGLGGLAGAETERPSAAARPGLARRFAACAALQGASLYVIFAVFSLNWLVPLLTVDYYLSHPDSVGRVVLALIGLVYALIPAHIVVSVALKWMIVGRFRAGRYPLWSLYYWRFWLAKRVLPLFAPTYLRGTPFLPLYYRLLGAKIGRHVHLGSSGLIATDLITIGDGAAISADVQLTGYAYRDGDLILGPVTIGANAVIGARSVLGLDTAIGADTEVGAHSLVTDGQHLGAGEHWQGSPAKRLPGPPPAAATGDVKGRPLGTAAYNAAFLATILTLVIVPISAGAPSIVLWVVALNKLGLTPALCLTPLCVALFVVGWCAAVALTKRLLVGKVEAGSYHVQSWLGIRRWCVDELLDAGLDVIFPLYATLYLKPFLKALGTKVGRCAEVSTAAHFQPDLVQLGDGSFLADAVCLAPTRVAHGIASVGPVAVGKNAFIGNSACVPAGTELGDGALIGCQSRPPMALTKAALPQTSWIGSPGVLLPRRTEAPGFADRYTYKPTRRLIALRLAIEFWRITLPDTIGFVVAALFVKSLLGPFHDWPLAGFLAALPAWSLGVAAALALIVVGLKWLIVGRYKAGAKPLWSDFVWRTELVDALHEHLAAPAFLNLVKGTPLVPLYFRLMGTKIGKRALIESINITEFDLVELGDDVCLDNECDLQTHLFEDRVMKMSTVTVGDRVSVGPSTVVLYDSVLGDDTSLGGMSLLMKGESLPPRTRWHGAPLVQQP